MVHKRPISMDTSQSWEEELWGERFPGSTMIINLEKPASLTIAFLTLKRVF